MAPTCALEAHGGKSSADGGGKPVNDAKRFGMNAESREGLAQGQSDLAASRAAREEPAALAPPSGVPYSPSSPGSFAGLVLWDSFRPTRPLAFDFAAGGSAYGTGSAARFAADDCFVSTTQQVWPVGLTDLARPQPRRDPPTNEPG